MSASTGECSVSIPCRPYCRKQISQSQSIKTLAYLFSTIRPAWDTYNFIAYFFEIRKTKYYIEL